MAEINIDEVTIATEDGTGSFDELMKAVDSKVQLQFTSNRISSTDYGKLYASAVDSVLRESIAFTLGRQIADKQAELLDVQRDKVLAEIDILVINKEQSEAQVAKTNAETALIIQETSNATIQGEILVQEKAKLIADTALVTQNTKNALTANSNLQKIGTKTDQEKQLLQQKTVTEKAQTTNSPTLGGVVGAQIALYNKQRDGFDRNAEQAAAKIVADNISVQRSTDEGKSMSGTGFEDTNIKRVMTKLLTGINA